MSHTAAFTTTQTGTIQSPTVNLRLQLQQQEEEKKEQKRVSWEDDVVDNEFLNKKKSNSM